MDRKSKPGLVIELGGMGRGRRGGSKPPMDDMGGPDMDDMGGGEEMASSSVDMALEDAFNAVKSGDMRGFKEAMLDALESLR